METAEIKNSLGTIRISDQVIASIAQAATLHVKGIYAMDDRFSHAISSVINDEETRGIRVSIDNKSIVVDLYVAVYHGFLLLLLIFKKLLRKKYWILPGLE